MPEYTKIMRIKEENKMKAQRKRVPKYEGKRNNELEGVERRKKKREKRMKKNF